MPKRILGKWTEDGDLNCAACYLYEREPVSERNFVPGEDDACKKGFPAVHDGGNCRHWKSKDLTAPPQACT